MDDLMNTTICNRIATVHFWDGYARWYKLWAEHTNYHDPIIKMLKEIIKPGWKVLDIGAGSGVLSLPLAQMGCKVTALEPSIGMRNFLFQEMFRQGVDNIEVDQRRWEDVSLLDYQDIDLILSCNPQSERGVENCHCPSRTAASFNSLPTLIARPIFYGRNPPTAVGGGDLTGTVVERVKHSAFVNMAAV